MCTPNPPPKKDPEITKFLIPDSEINPRIANTNCYALLGYCTAGV